MQSSSASDAVLDFMVCPVCKSLYWLSSGRGYCPNTCSAVSDNRKRMINQNSISGSPVISERREEEPKAPPDEERKKPRKFCKFCHNQGYEPRSGKPCRKC